ncbi:sentrin-specific protease 2 [Trichomycterus rosablanca]|uniref:sentrin-specific protease 2 n=1 Tax=Trichomycterus rosablanca TaxID=2290929 RepID=UPI002F356EC3
MYEWIVDGLSSLFVPFSVFSGGNSTSYPVDNPPLAASTPATVTIPSQPQQLLQENTRAAKRNYQSVHSPDGTSDHLEIKRPRRDVIVRVVKKTFAGIAGLLRLRQHKSCQHGGDKDYRQAQVENVSLMGIDEIHSNTLNKWMISGNGEMEKQKEMGFTNKEKTVPNFCVGAQPLIRKPNGGAMLYMGNQDRPRDRPQRRSLQLLPSRPGLPEIGQPSRTHKHCLAVEEALKESDRKHYRRLVEMVSEKYSKNKPLPFGRKPPNTTFPSDGSKSLGRLSEISKPVPIKVNPHVPMWRDPTSANHTRERLVITSSALVSDSRNYKPDQSLDRAKPVDDVDLSVEVETRLNLKEREPSALSQQTVQIRSESLLDTGRCSDEEFPRLTKEMQQEVSAALAQRDPNLVLSSAFKLRITQRDLATLREGCWLNDEVINFYLNLVMARSEQDEGALKVYCFSTFFFPKLHGGGHAAVRRWTKAVDLFLYDVILIPLHLGVHWSLAAVDFRRKSVRSFDSMGQRHEDICDLILMYLKEECNVKKGKDLEVLKWTVTSLRASELPQQKNGSDCGVFACKYADYLARGHPCTFRQCHMPYFRKAMIWEILNQKLLQ